MSRHSKTTVVLFLVLLCIFPMLVIASAGSASSSTSTEYTPSLTGSKTASASVISHLKLDYGGHEDANQTETILRHVIRDEGSELAKNIRIITIRGWGSITNWTLLSTSLQKFHRLDELHWDHNDAPRKAVLAALESHHSACKLYYKVVFSNRDRYAEDYVSGQAPGDEPHRERRIASREEVIGSKNVYAIKTEIEYGPDPNLDSMAYIQRLIQHSENLKELDLNLYHKGCVVSGGQPRAFNFTDLDVKFPPLQKLRLSGYEFGERVDGRDDWFRRRYTELFKWPWDYLPLSIRSILPYEIVSWMIKEDVPSGAPTPPNLAAWLQKMDWSSLEELHLDTVSEIELPLLAPSLKSLKSFSLGHAERNASKLLPAFLAGTNNRLEAVSLKNIRVDSLDPIVQVLTARHSSSLKSLGFHEGEEFRQVYCMHHNDTSRCSGGRFAYYQDRPFLNATSLLRIAASCPNIESLEVDVDRMQNYVALKSALDSLGLFTRLKNLALNFDSPDFARTKSSQNNETRSRRDDNLDEMMRGFRCDSLVNTTFAKDTFKYLREMQRERLESSGTQDVVPSLTSLEIKLGYWDYRYDYGMGGALGGKRLLGHFTCHVENKRAEDGAWVEAESCSGQYAYNMGYHDFSVNDGECDGNQDGLSASMESDGIQFVDEAHDELLELQGLQREMEL